MIYEFNRNPRYRYEQARKEFNRLLTDYATAKGPRARKELYDRIVANYEHLVQLMQEIERSENHEEPERTI